MRTTATIHESYRPSLVDRVNKLNRRAARMGLPGMTLTFDEPGFTKESTYTTLSGKRVPRFDHYFDVTVEGETPRIEGWTLVGMVDYDPEIGALTRTVPGETMPKEFRDADPCRCDKCHTRRRRTIVFVLRNEDNDHIQVGGTCLRDYLGHINPHDLVEFMTFAKWVNSLSDFEPEFMGECGGTMERRYRTRDLLAVTRSIIRKDGWLSKTAAREQERAEDATAAKADLYCFPPYKADAGYWKWHQSVTPTKADWECADAAMEWVRASTDDSDYMHNLKVMVEADTTIISRFGLVCSAVGSYLRAMDRAKELAEARKASLNEHRGEIGKRERGVTLTCTKRRTTEGFYGATTILTFRDEDGRTITWFASGDRYDDFEPETEYVCDFTVKKHDTYNDWAQTVVNRLTVKETVEA